jgi:hypothetical protein
VDATGSVEQLHLVGERPGHAKTSYKLLRVNRRRKARAAGFPAARAVGYGVTFAKSTSRLNGCGGAKPVQVMPAKLFVEAMPL